MFSALQGSHYKTYLYISKAIKDVVFNSLPFAFNLAINLIVLKGYFVCNVFLVSEKDGLRRQRGMMVLVKIPHSTVYFSPFFL